MEIKLADAVHTSSPTSNTGDQATQGINSEPVTRSSRIHEPHRIVAKV